MSYLHHCSSPLTVLGLLHAPLSAYSAITTHLISLWVEKHTSAGTEIFTAKRQSSCPQLEWGRLSVLVGVLSCPFWSFQSPTSAHTARWQSFSALSSTRHKWQLQVVCLSVNTCADTFACKGLCTKIGWAAVWPKLQLNRMALSRSFSRRHMAVSKYTFLSLRSEGHVQGPAWLSHHDYMTVTEPATAVLSSLLPWQRGVVLPPCHGCLPSEDVTWSSHTCAAYRLQRPPLLERSHSPEETSLSSE